MDLSQWLVGEIDDITTRLRTQMLEIVPPSRRRERPGGGSPILWNTFHAARHASLALAVLSPEPGPERNAWLEALVSKAGPGIGVEEAAPPWADELSPEQADRYLDGVLASARRFLAGPAIDLDAVPDTGGARVAGRRHCRRRPDRRRCCPDGRVRERAGQRLASWHVGHSVNLPGYFRHPVAAAVTATEAATSLRSPEASPLCQPEE